MLKRLLLIVQDFPWGEENGESGLVFGFFFLPWREVGAGVNLVGWESILGIDTWVVLKTKQYIFERRDLIGQNVNERNESTATVLPMAP